MSLWRSVCVCVIFLVAMGLADPDLLKRPSRPSRFGSESQVRKYIADLKEYIRQNPSSRYGKRYIPSPSGRAFPDLHRDDNRENIFQAIYSSEDYENLQ